MKIRPFLSRWPTNPFRIVPSAPTITGTTLVLMNQGRFSLCMRCILLGFSFEPRLYSCTFETEGSGISLTREDKFD